MTRSMPTSLDLVTRQHDVLGATGGNAPHQQAQIKNTVAVQRGLTGGIGWRLTSWVRPARLGRRVVATALREGTCLIT